MPSTPTLHLVGAHVRSSGTFACFQRDAHGYHTMNSTSLHSKGTPRELRVNYSTCRHHGYFTITSNSQSIHTHKTHARATLVPRMDKTHKSSRVVCPPLSPLSSLFSAGPSLVPRLPACLFVLNKKAVCSPRAQLGARLLDLSQRSATWPAASLGFDDRQGPSRARVYSSTAQRLHSTVSVRHSAAHVSAPTAEQSKSERKGKGI